jgi:hypothetical protein
MPRPSFLALASAVVAVSAMVLAAVPAGARESVDVGPLPMPSPCAVADRILERATVTDDDVLDLLRLEERAVPALADALGRAPGPPAQVALLEALAVAGEWTDGALAGPWLFSLDPDIATAAAYALYQVQGTRAAPALERMVSAGNGFGQTLLAVEALRDIALPHTFATLAALAEDPQRDPVLRAEAAMALPALDQRRTRKWLKSLRLPVDTNPFLAGELIQLFSAVEPAEKRPGDRLFR